MEASNELKVNLHQLLRAMIEKGASDLHIATGSPPLLRVDGAVVPLKLPALGPVETKQLCYSVLTEDQRRAFETDKELDLSFGVKGLSRYAPICSCSEVRSRPRSAPSPSRS
jgi:twitching motility protein PilT